MRNRFAVFVTVSAIAVSLSTACATKKHVRNRVTERMTPLEQRTGELEETSRRNTQDISRLGEGVTDVRERSTRAQSRADGALARANEANTRVSSAEQMVSDVRTNLDRYTTRTTATVNFSFDSAGLSPEAKLELDRLAGQISDRQNFVLEMQGFADDKGTDIYNYELTQRRADSVRRYLASQHQIPLFKMHVLGLGEARAVADNRTPEGRAQNRRVEVRLLTRTISNGSGVTNRTSSAARP
jgi:outer membrane protein OmpA-like peptidoglycan-associated protein